MTINEPRKFAIVTGASTGIGLELAKNCAANGYDLLIVADEPEIEAAAETLRRYNVVVHPLVADLATPEGVNRVLKLAEGRNIDALLANAGRGLGHGFLDQEFPDILNVLNTNVTGTLMLIHEIGRKMRAAKGGKILVTGSIAGFMPGAFQAVYNGTKALLDSFCYALREELKDTGITVTCLMPGPTETEFFKRADLLDTKVGTDKKQPADEVAKAGFEAMLAGDAGVVTGFANKLQVAFSHLVPDTALAEKHRQMTEPGTASKNA
jgi:uncharacterized protein